MKKIIYNNCHGGYGISPKALKWLKKNTPIDSIWHDDGIQTVYNNVCLGKLLDKSRTDEYLIELLEEKGTDYVSGLCSQLKVYNAGSSIVRIEAYDGRESVYEIDDPDLHIL